MQAPWCLRRVLHWTSEADLRPSLHSMETRGPPPEAVHPIRFIESVSSWQQRRAGRDCGRWSGWACRRGGPGALGRNSRRAIRATCRHGGSGRRRRVGAVEQHAIRDVGLAARVPGRGAVLAGVGGPHAGGAGRSRRPGTPPAGLGPGSAGGDAELVLVLVLVRRRHALAVEQRGVASARCGVPGRSPDDVGADTMPDHARSSGGPAVRRDADVGRGGGAGTLAGVRDDAVVDAVLCHAGRGIAGPRDTDAARGHARTRDPDRNATTRGRDVRHADAAASGLRCLAGERHAERRCGVGAAARGRTGEVHARIGSPCWRIGTRRHAGLARDDGVSDAVAALGRAD